jgi:TetR/AcrR family transcriptional regulator
MSVTDWKAREKEQRRNDIISAALMLFASKGYENISMDDIANEIKLGKATLYRYFNNKESLFFAVVLSGVRIYHTMVMEGAKNAGTGAEKLTAVAGASIEFRNKYPEYNHINNYYYSGRFDLAGMARRDDKSGHVTSRDNDKPIELADSENVKEIPRLLFEVFETARDAIKTGREDRSILPGMDPVELAILLSLTTNSMQNLNPVFKRFLEYFGINYDQFMGDSQAFLYKNILANPSDIERL